MSNGLPKAFSDFVAKHPNVADAYQKLGQAVHAAGPLDAKTRALVKLAISIGARLEGGVHSHVRKALAEGCSHEEVRQVVLLALPTVGLPSMMAARTWVEDLLSSGAAEEKV